MNDFDRPPDGEGDTNGKERRALPPIAAVTNPARHDLRLKAGVSLVSLRFSRL
jgi:hypothetical protein